MKGYYKNQQQTNNKIVNGYLKTGDIGFIDKSKKLHIVGRKDDMIIKAGMNIYPAKIENKLYQLKEIKDILIYPTKDPTGFVSIGANIIPQDDISLTTIEFRRMFAKVLPTYQIPTDIHFVKTIPKTTSGKKNTS